MKKTFILIAVGTLLGSTIALAASKFFSDVPAGQWYAGAIASLSEKGIISGYPDGTFGPGKNVSRAEIAVMLDNTIQYLQTGKVSKLQTANLQSYKNDTLKLAFSYPQDWGNVSQKNDGTDHIALSVFEAATIFLAADNGGESVGRGAYWGDGAESIDSQSYIDNLCSAKSEAQSCEIKTNSSGVKYAKVVEEVMKFDDSTVETNYYIYNPNSTFRGIIISTERLRAKNIESLETKLQKLIDSFYFTD